MNTISRGIRNAFRNVIRTFSIVVILGLSLGLAMSMVIAHQAVGQKIKSVEGSVGNTVSISPAGVRGFSGGGNPLTTADATKVKSLANVVSIEQSLNDRLTTSTTNLVSSVNLGSLGQRFAQNSGFSSSGGGGFGGGGGTNNSGGSLTFTPPITVLGTTSPTDLSNTTGGGTFSLTSGSVFSSDSSANVALVGSDLASKNNLKVGSTFTAYSTTIKVVGIFNSGNSFSNSMLIMPLTTVQTLSSQVGDITSIILAVNSVNNVGSVTTAATNALGSAADVTNAAAQAKLTIAPLQSIQSISLYSLVGAVIAGSIIILLTMVMIVRERRREIGVTKAIGATNISIMLQFMTEAITLTMLGAVIGILVGIVAGNPITKLLVNNSSSSTSSSTFGSAGASSVTKIGGGGRDLLGGLHNSLSSIQTNVGWSILVYGLLAALVIAIVGSAIASLIISKIRPAEVMRVE
jgi:putative ABC transport system permease protein